MSLEISRHLVCDTKDTACVAIFHIQPSESMKEARARAAAIDWTSTVGRYPKDYCPFHPAASR